MSFIYSTITIFGLTALLGMYLLSMILRGKTTPKGVSMMHGLLAVTALILLFVYAGLHPPGPIASIIVFCMAATGGIVLIYRDVTDKPIPKWLGIGHGLLAITGFVLLILFALNGKGVIE